MRQLQKVIQARPTQDGDGVKIHRLAGQRLTSDLNPFLMIDEINSDSAADYIGGFPEHPHRGFETITYMKAGRMRHRDHLGNEGVIGAGDIQWMTAGAGVLHSEMPEQEEGLLHGFQVWLNLPAAEKMKPAAYQEIKSQSIQEQILSKGGEVRVIAGDVAVKQGDTAPVALEGCISAATTEPVFIDVQLEAHDTVELSFNSHNAAMVYVYKGAVEGLAQRELGIYGQGESLLVTATDSGAGFLVLSGRPIDEAIAQYGPFVMNTTEELEQALQDFRDPVFLASLRQS